jgi:DNA-binding PadR family transcriptional regulator
MSLEHAILGFLQYKPFTGYDLKAVFDTSVHHFWPADQSQIYRTLARLAQRGWAEVDVIHRDDRPVRKVYHITDAGREEFRRWLTVPVPRQEPRNARLIQVFFAGQLSDEEILAVFEQEAKEMRDLLAPYAQIPTQAEPFAKLVGSPREVFFWLLTLEAGIRTAEAHMAWVESVIERIRNKQHPSE